MKHRIESRLQKNETNTTRRDFFRAMAAASAAALMANEPRLLHADEAGAAIQHPTAKADACILLWMGGGMAAPETFDPKRYQPFEVGLPVEKVMSTFPAIDTVVDNIKISQGLENVARVMDRGTLIRSHVLPDLGHILHSRHQYHWHTGYVPPQSVAAPHIGSWMARVLGPVNPVMPPFINIGQRFEGNGEAEELKAFTTGGFFGSEYGPFNLPFPEDASMAVRPPKGMDAGRFENRFRRYQELHKSRCCDLSTLPIDCSTPRKRARSICRWRKKKTLKNTMGANSVADACSHGDSSRQVRGSWK
jgi:hypothetical protein